MDSFEEIKIVNLKDGSQIQLRDDDEISIEKLTDGNVVSSVAIEFPSAGYAGGELHVSPCESYILFAFYSGQSEEAFTLLKNGETIEVVFESGYEFGEAASYSFSSDRRTLYQGLPCSCCDWWMPWDENDLEEDPEGNKYFYFGAINIFDIQSRELTKCEIRIQPTTSWKPSEKQYDPLLFKSLSINKELVVSWPWGEEVLNLPLANVLIYKPNGEPSFA